MANPVASSNPFSTAFDNAYKAASPYIQKTKSFYCEAENQVKAVVESMLPDDLKYVAEKVSRAIPETLFSASMITGTLPVAALCIGVAKIFWAISPILNAAIHGNFQDQVMQQACVDAQSRFVEIKNNFRPAIFVAAAVGAAASTVLGIVNVSPSYLMIAAFLGVVSHMAFDAIEKPKPEPLPSAPPAEEAAKAPEVQID